MRWKVGDYPALDRAEQTAKYVERTEEKLRRDKKTLPSQLATATDLRKDGRRKGPQHQESGVNAAARALKISKDTSTRLVAAAGAIYYFASGDPMKQEKRAGGARYAALPTSAPTSARSAANASLTRKIPRRSACFPR